MGRVRPLIENVQEQFLFVFLAAETNDPVGCCCSKRTTPPASINTNVFDKNVRQDFSVVKIEAFLEHIR